MVSGTRRCGEDSSQATFSDAFYEMKSVAFNQEELGRERQVIFKGFLQAGRLLKHLVPHGGTITYYRHSRTQTLPRAPIGATDPASSLAGLIVGF